MRANREIRVGLFLERRSAGGKGKRFDGNIPECEEWRAGKLAAGGTMAACEVGG